MYTRVNTHSALSFPRSHKNSPKLTAIQFLRSYFGEFGIRLINNLIIYIFSIPLTCLLDIILILYGEIMFWSPMGVYGLIQYPEEAEKHLQ